jgi:sugar phosphate permease
MTSTGAALFYGWRIVGACFVIASIAWSLGLFGASVYLHAVSETRGWPIGLISTAITCFYLVSAFSAPFVGTVINRFGPRAIVRGGAICLACSVASIGQVTAIWQIYLSFLILGLGWASLSSTALSTIVAPWFNKHQGRAISMALMGASIGGIAGVPLLLLAIAQLGLVHATLAAAIVCLVVLLPLSFVLHLRPQDIGLLPDGIASLDATESATERSWTRVEAARTQAFRSIMLAFGIGFLVQVGFLTHHVSYLVPALGSGGASATVAGTAIAAFVGRMLLARYVDSVNPRTIACGVFCVGASALASLSLTQTPILIIAASLLYGLTVGNVTTLPSIVVRREFGAPSFGAIYGLAALAIGLCAALAVRAIRRIFRSDGTGIPVEYRCRRNRPARTTRTELTSLPTIWQEPGHLVRLAHLSRRRNCAILLRT